MDSIELDFTIAVRNSENTVGKCISSILQNVPDQNIHHIVVVDNSSTDKTVSIVKDFAGKNKKIRLFFENGRLGKVRLTQAEKCDTDYVAFIDSDVYINNEWLTEMSKHLTEKAGFVVARLSMAYSEPYNSFLSWSLVRFGCVAIGCTIVKRDIVLRKGKELENLHAALEDVVIYKYAKENGYECVYVSDKSLGVHEGDSDQILEIKHRRAGNSYKLARGLPLTLIQSIKNFITNPAKAILYYTEKKVTLKDFLFLFILQIKLAFEFLSGVISNDVISEIKK